MLSERSADELDPLRLRGTPLLTTMCKTRLDHVGRALFTVFPPFAVLSDNILTVVTVRVHQKH
jgi:hypothetical protein